ncbi:hypothetical protein Droror1_Dr00003212 [Drosera rotundifolia]
MNARTAAPSDRVYEDFNPPTTWNHRDAANIFCVYLPDFNKENLRVQLTASKMLRISGQRSIDGIRWKRFRREEELPENSDTTQISAKFQDGGLEIRVPKLVPPVKQETPAVEAPQPPVATTTIDQPPPRPTLSLPPTQQEKSDSRTVTNEKPGKANETQAGGEVVPLPKIPEKGNEAEEEQKEEEEENIGRKEDDTSKSEAINQPKESMSTVTPWSRKSSVDFYNKLKNPRNLQKMVTIVVLGALAGLLIISMLKWCKSENKDL